MSSQHRDTFNTPVNPNRLDAGEVFSRLQVAEALGAPGRVLDANELMEIGETAVHGQVSPVQLSQPSAESAETPASYGTVMGAPFTAVAPRRRSERPATGNQDGPLISVKQQMEAQAAAAAFKHGQRNDRKGDVRDFRQASKPTPRPRV